MLTNTELTKLMYRVMGELNNTSAPLVFKGAMVLQQVLRDHGFTKINRATVDIDCDWTGSPPSMEVLRELVTHSIRDFKDTLSVEIKRDYNADSTACLVVIDKDTKIKIFKIDIGVFPVLGDKIYHNGEISFRGVLPNEIICDKLTVLSSDRILRRSKDFLDIFLLANCISIDTDSIYLALKEKSRFPLGSFDVFLNRTGELEHAYNKLKRMTDKPDFNDVFSYLKKFLPPFIANDQESLLWDIADASWKVKTG
jgi:hypothetical protein